MMVLFRGATAAAVLLMLVLLQAESCFVDSWTTPDLSSFTFPLFRGQHRPTTKPHGSQFISSSPHRTTSLRVVEPPGQCSSNEHENAAELTTYPIIRMLDLTMTTATPTTHSPPLSSSCSSKSTKPIKWKRVHAAAKSAATTRKDGQDYKGSYPNDDGTEKSQKGNDFVPTTNTTTLAFQAAMNTWNWCSKFVVEHQLCPWAKSSVDTPNALQLFIVLQDTPVAVSTLQKLDILKDLAVRFQDCLIAQEADSPVSSSSLESVLIFFCVFVPTDNSETSFLDFYSEFFDDIEQAWLEDADSNVDSDDSTVAVDTSKIILAPFHPDWAYGDDDRRLDLEKHSPYPTISLVSARVVDQAGSKATSQIGIHNEQTLTSKSLPEWQRIWNEACSSKPGDY